MGRFPDLFDAILHDAGIEAVEPVGGNYSTAP
jgi:hypothetical protein